MEARQQTPPRVALPKQSAPFSPFDYTPHLTEEEEGDPLPATRVEPAGVRRGRGTEQGALSPLSSQLDLKYHFTTYEHAGKANLGQINIITDSSL